jgi:biopolymer transport protein ExbD
MAGQIIQSGMAGQVMAGLRRRRNPAMGLRMTAMIDVIFLLLTFFVLTARFQQPESHLNVTLPKPAVGTEQSAAKEPLSIRLETANLRCSVLLPQAETILLVPDTLSANLADLHHRLTAIFPLYDIAGQGVELRCDDAVQWDYVVKVYDVLYRAGAMKITFVTEEKTASAPDSVKNPQAQ